MKFKLEDEIGMTFEDAQKPGKDEICASCQYNVAGTCTLKPKDLEKCQEAFNKLVTEWVDGKNALDYTFDVVVTGTQAQPQA